MVDQVSVSRGDVGRATGGLSLGRWLISRERDRRRERIVGTALMVAAVALAAWTVSFGLNDSPRAIHRAWSLSTYVGMNPRTLIWIGVDVLEAAGLALTGLLLRLGRPATQTVALLSIPLFVLDAWFDVLMSASPHNLAIALAMAGLEIPAAMTCGWVAWKASRF